MGELIFVAVTVPFGWNFLSKVQRNFIVFAPIEKYIVGKFIVSLFIGWAVAPFYIIYWLFKLYKSKKDNVVNQ